MEHSQRSNYKVINYTFSFLNVFVPFLSGASYFIVKLSEKFYCPDFKVVTCHRYEMWNSIQVNTRFVIAALEIVSGGFLAYGVLKIRALIREGTNADVNIKQLTLHVVAFTFFLVSVIASYTYYGIYKWGPNALTTQSLNKYDKATIASNVLSFFAQLGQIWILTQFTSKRQGQSLNDTEVE